MKNLSRKKLLSYLLILILGIILFIGSSFLIKINSSPAQVSKIFSDQNKLTEGKKTSLILVGDIMLDRGVEYMIKKEGGGDFKFPFLKIVRDLKKGDILFGNLEGPISDKGVKVGSIYSFRVEPEAIEGLNYAGFDVLSVANNHIFDYGKEALEDTFKRLKEVGIDYVGGGFNEKEAYSPIIKELNSSINSPQTKIGFLAYTNLGSPYWVATDKSSGIAWINWKDLEKIRKDIKKIKSQVNILIVSLHSGEEYSSQPTQFQIEFSKAVIDAGADLVVGHHPHIIQPIEKYKQGWIVYSLGNFVFDQSFSKETIKGQMIKVLIENGEIKEVIPINIKINNYFQPEILE